LKCDRLSSRVLLAALSIPPQRDEDKENEYIVEVDDHKEPTIQVDRFLGDYIEQRDLLFEELVLFCFFFSLCHFSFQSNEIMNLFGIIIILKRWRKKSQVKSFLNFGTSLS
jgi:hypothetical protein